MITPRVLLVGHETSHEVLAASRSLASAGWRVHVATGARRSLAGASASVSSEYRVTAPDRDLAAFTYDVGRASIMCGAQVVIGCGDPELLALSAVRDQLPVQVPLAEHAVVLRAVDKLTLTQAAMQVGLSVPETRVAHDDAVATWLGPAVVKPRLHWAPTMSGSPMWTPACLTESKHDLEHAVRLIRASGREPVLQEPVVGDLFALSAVRTAQGRIVGLLQQRATRTWPPQTGVSSRATTVAVDPALADGVMRLLHELGWVGMAQLQFLQPDEGPPRLLDLNGRPYGSLPLATAADLPLLALWLGCGSESRSNGWGAPAGPAVARQGATYSRGGHELRRAFSERRGGLARDLISTTRAWWGAAHPVADRHDWRPLLRVVPLAAEDKGRSLLARRPTFVTRNGIKRRRTTH